jgi:hypothetical protein
MNARNGEFPGVTLAMISWRAWRTVENTLASYETADVLGLFGARRVHFNEIAPEDRAIADRYGFAATGTPGNVGIFGAVDAVARATDTTHLLMVENDCPLVTDRHGLVAMLTTTLADMADEGVDVFVMRSRRQPGDPFWRAERYMRYFAVHDRLAVAPPPPGRIAPPLPTDTAARLRRVYEDRRRPRLRGSAIYAEEDPTVRHPAVVRRSAHGNWITSSRYLHWTNCCYLVRTDFLRDVVLDRVRHHPAPTTLNGHQDIEAALKHGRWWSRQSFTMGQCEPGPFTHVRLDR